MEPATSALEVWSLNHWTAKEVPEFFVLIQIFDPFYTSQHLINDELNQSIKICV